MSSEMTKILGSWAFNRATVARPTRPDWEGEKGVSQGAIGDGRDGGLSSTGTYPARDDDETLNQRILGLGERATRVRVRHSECYLRVESAGGTERGADVV